MDKRNERPGGGNERQGRRVNESQQGGGRGAGGAGEWDRQQGIAGTERQMGSTGGGGMDPTQGGHGGASEWDQQQGRSEDERQQGGGSADMEEDKRRHQDRGQGDIESDRQR